MHSFAEITVFTVKFDMSREVVKAGERCENFALNKKLVSGGEIRAKDKKIFRRTCLVKHCCYNCDYCNFWLST